ncbi:MAG: trypsin-like peptidase domain-containing protein [Dehalococcoidales bacterium]|nr:trypsin-like peptidase domain-containing protein [Dehalococcoidales bacterium]
MTATPTPLVNPTATPATSLAEVIARVKSAVVKIQTSGGSGSGLIFTQAGYVLTNKHVVSNESLVQVILVTGDKFDGIVVARDEHRDLAIVGIISNRTDFPSCTLGSSSGILVGEEVVAIGYSLGLQGQSTVSKGIVSAVRSIEGVDYIQTDAAINPGNSGSPLVNLKGEAVGVNVAKFVSVDIEGIGLAIPIDEAKAFINDKT